MNQAGFFAAMLAGLLGGVHCVGMCGGIVSALSLGIDANARRARLWRIQLGYNLGRILSYTLAGAIAGGIGLLLARSQGAFEAQRLLYLLAATMTLSMGLYLGGWLNLLRRVEVAGGALWRRIEPLGRRFMPVRGFAQALALGLVWGWLPCGLVYSMLIWSLSAGDAAHGAWLMLGFGLGTLPNLLLMGALATRMRAFTHRPWVRRLAGGLVIALALSMFWQALWA